MICLNCNEEIQEGDLFCDETCEQEYEEYRDSLADIQPEYNQPTRGEGA